MNVTMDNQQETKIIGLITFMSRILRDYTFYTKPSFRFAEEIVHKFYNVILWPGRLRIISRDYAVNKIPFLYCVITTIVNMRTPGIKLHKLALFG